MKINFACGKQTWPGFFCIDAVAHPKAQRKPDLIHALKFDGKRLVNPIPLTDGVADEMHCYHFIEHVFRWEASAVLMDFRRLLKPGGLLVLELPNIELACKNLLAGKNDQMSMWPLYGDWGHQDPYMMHKHGYTQKTIAGLLKECGFKHIKLLPPQSHGRKKNRDMRVESLA